MANRQPIAPEFKPETMKVLTTPAEPPKQKKENKKSIQNERLFAKEFYQLVSVNVAENAPLKPILIELARQADVDLQLDPRIESKIVCSARKEPFIQVIESICELGNLRYKVMGKSLRIEIDTPYTKTYNVQFLNLSRNSQNRISTATDVFSNTANPNAPKSNVGDNGSNSAVTVSGANDFWAELESNLKVILGHEGGGTDEGQAFSYSLHKQGGMVSISGNSKQHKMVENYLSQLKQAASTQVLIEAKIVEVALNDEFRSGINWQKIGNRSDWQLDARFGDLAKKGRFMHPSAAQNEMISMGAAGKTFSAILEALQEFGSSRTLSSPRLTVMNNQTAILKVAQNQVYFRLNYDKQYNTAVQRESVNVSSDIQTVPIGLVMSVQPSIDSQTGEIILFLRPTISRLSQSVRDPAVDIAYNANASVNGANTIQAKPSLIPVVEVREIDSVLRLKNEEIAILGGLMEVRSTQDTSKLPVLGDMPIFKELFSAYTDGDQVIELVILLRATILTEGFGPDAADRRLMDGFIPDPRPFINAVKT